MKSGTVSMETLRHSRVSRQTHTYYLVESCNTLSQATLFHKPTSRVNVTAKSKH